MLRLFLDRKYVVIVDLKNTEGRRVEMQYYKEKE